MLRSTPKFTGWVDTVVPMSRANGSHFGEVPDSGCRASRRGGSGPGGQRQTDDGRARQQSDGNLAGKSRRAHKQVSP